VAGTLIGYTWLRGVDEVIPGLTFHFPGPIVLAVASHRSSLGVLAAILPARRAARLKVIEALVYE
jgi:ABC-type lipoprotein release transport system permease subunit